MVVRLTGEQLQLARRLRARGMTLREIAKSVGCTDMNVWLVLRSAECKRASKVATLRP
jgi:transcriptional regulator